MDRGTYIRISVISILVVSLLVASAGTIVVDPVSAKTLYNPPRQDAKNSVNSGVIYLQDIDSGLTSPSGDYRWLDIADQKYGETYISNYNYTQATVEVQYKVERGILKGTLTATNLKPNFVYQVKLEGNPEEYPEANERIGLAGRWWREEWDGTKWTNGQNLNNKGDGSSPNPNDGIYFSTKDNPDPTSPTGLHYRYRGYLVFDYFITDETGNATINFTVNSSYHVLWKTIQRAHTSKDGPIKSSTFDPDLSSPAYDSDYPENTISVFGEWERLPLGGIYLDNGNYSCNFILTEESFHGSGDDLYDGGWAAAMGAPIAFEIEAEAPPLLPFDCTADLFVLDSGSSSILRINPRGTVAIEVTKEQIDDVAGEGGDNYFGDNGIAFDAYGTMYFVASVTDDGDIFKREPGRPVTMLASQSALESDVGGVVDVDGLAFGSDGLLYVSDDGDQRVLQVDPDTGAALVHTTKAAFEALAGITSVDIETGIVGTGGGIIYVVSEEDDGFPNAIFAIAPDGMPSVLASGDPPFDDLDVFMTRAPNGDLIVADNSGADTIHRVTPAGVVTTFLSKANLEAVSGEPVDLEGGIAFDSAGNFYVAEAASNDILKFTPDLQGSIWVSADDIEAVTGNVPILDGGIAFAPCFLPEGVYELPLYTGWNLVSLPLIPNSIDIEDILAGIVPNLVTAWAYDGPTKVWSNYNPEAIVNSLTEMDDGIGYWVRVKNPCTLIIVGP